MLNHQGPLSRTFHALADPTRMAIIDRLSRGPASVSELARPLEMSLAAVMQHIQVLELSALVRSEKRGRVRTCSIEPATLLAAQDWIAARRQSWESQLDRLGALLDAEDREHKTGKRKP
ncbi:MAG: ArsR family transcriptional regulator [Rhodospirillaceae bacterium]|nr:MAG: ArsR family transcriptional regulator [Rhodospirillaceae bacterium]